MATFDPRHDHDHWPAGHYGGHGNDQQGTGPNGPWLERGPSRWMRPPRPRRNQPRNYFRRDERIFEDVCEVLSGHGDLDVSDIEVRVDDGDVLLCGTVRSRWAKWYAEDLARSVGGVGDIVNDLRITWDGGPTDDGRGGQLPKRHYP